MEANLLVDVRDVQASLVAAYALSVPGTARYCSTLCAVSTGHRVGGSGDCLLLAPQTGLSAAMCYHKAQPGTPRSPVLVPEHLRCQY
eukprot:3941987-Rhodomonas_salina.1